MHITVTINYPNVFGFGSSLHAKQRQTQAERQSGRRRLFVPFRHQSLILFDAAEGCIVSVRFVRLSTGYKFRLQYSVPLFITRATF